MAEEQGRQWLAKGQSNVEPSQRNGHRPASSSWFRPRKPFFFGLFLGALPVQLLALGLIAGVLIDAYLSSGPPEYIRNVSPGDHILEAGNPNLQPQWTPDGERIMFAYGGSIYEAWYDGGGLRKIFEPAGEHDINYSPDIHPDGSRVVYATTRYGFEYSTFSEFSRNFEIEELWFDMPTPHRLTLSDDQDISPAWSPDGDRIAYAKISNYPGEFRGIHTLNWNDPNYRFKQLIAPARVLDFDKGEDAGDLSLEAGPIWSPAGDMLAYIVGGIEYERLENGWGDRSDNDVIFVVKTDGSKPIRVFASTDMFQDGISKTLAWSPDGQRLAFGYHHYHQNDASGVYTVSPDGTDLRKVSDASPVFYSLSWSPNATDILFTTNTNSRRKWREEGDVYIAKADGSGSRLLGTGTYASWSPDGSRIAVITEFSDSYLYTMAPDGSDVWVLARREDDGDLKAAR